MTKKPAVSKITLKNVVFTGMTTKLCCDTLLTWMAPANGLIGMIATGPRRQAAWTSSRRT